MPREHRGMGMSAPTVARPLINDSHRLAALPVGLIALTVAVVHLVAGSLGRGYWIDEALMLALGRNHLDWGAAEQPPLTPAIAWLADIIAPGSIAVLRIVPSLATAAAVVVAALIARELGGDRRAQVLTALAQATGLAITLVGHWLTPYSLEPLQWLLLVWLLVRWIRVRDDRLLLAVGPVLGVAALTKFQVILFGVVLLVALLITGPRELLRRRVLWWATLIGAVLAAPTLAWQALHGWPQLRMGPIVTSEAALYGGRPGVAISMVALAGLLGMILIVAGLVLVWTDPRLGSYRFLALSFAVLWALFVVTAGRPYYLDGLHGALVAIGAVGLQHRRESGHQRLSWIAWPGAALSIAAAAMMLPASAAFASPVFPDRITAAVDRVFSALPPSDQARTVVFSEMHVWAAYIDTATAALDLPPAYSGYRSYGYLQPPPDDHDLVIFVGRHPETLAPVGVDLRRIDTAAEPATSVWIGSGLDRPWSQAWPELREFAVG